MKILALRLVHPELPAICQLQFRFSYPNTRSHKGFWFWVSAQVSYGSLYSPDSPIFRAVACQVTLIL